MTSSDSVEQRLGKILDQLNEKHLKYDLLADELFSLWSDPSLPPAPSIERVLAGYFGLFALGYDNWQGCYDYHRIHEYFYGAYLLAEQVAGKNPSPELQELLEMLEQMTNAFIAYTWCENALICNDPQGLEIFATRAIDCGQKALEFLAQYSLGKPLSEPIEKYLNMNIELWWGFMLCAEMYLAASENKHPSSAKLSEVDQLIESLKHKSRELASELRAHRSFAQRTAQARAERRSDLLVDEGILRLRVTGYVGEDLTDKLFDKPNNELKDDIQKKTKLTIESIRPDSRQDIFDTVLGVEYREQVIIDLSTGEDMLKFTIRDGNKEESHSVETFQIRLASFGTISTEFEIPINNATVSHVRVLESLIAPYAGRFDFVWRDAPLDIGKGSTNYVDLFLESQEWIKSIKPEMPEAESTELIEMKKVLTRWKKELCKLAEWLHPNSPNGASQQDEQLDSIRQTLHQECFLRMREKAHQWIKAQESSTSSSVKKMVERGDRLFPPGIRFGLLRDIAVEVMNRIIKNYLSPKEDCDVQRLPPEGFINVRSLSSFDPDTGWAAILLCEDLKIVEREGQDKRREIEPNSESDYYGRVATHPEFKGFIIQPREARSGLDDWLFVKTPKYQNLAKIRSHETDAMYIGENHAFLYLPDDPQFLTEQYVETVRFVDDIRILLRSFNAIAKKQIGQLEKDFMNMVRSKSYQIEGRSKRESSAYLFLRRDEIEDFRTHAEKILDLLRSTAISRFQDHSELLQKMIKESRVNDIRNSLEHNIANLDRFHAYLTERLKRSIDNLS